VLASCLALDFYGIWTLANAPTVGVQFRCQGSAVVVSSLDADQALRRADVRVGERVLAIAGRPVNGAAFVPDPDNSASWSDRYLLWNWQRFLGEAVNAKSLSVVFDNGSGPRTVLCPVRLVGWKQAWQRSWALRLVGWSFLLLGFLIWAKKQSEASLVNLLACIGVFVSFSTMSAYINRDLAVSASALTLLTIFNYLGTQSTILTLHLGLVFPTPVFWLKRIPFIRVLPWCAYVLQLVLHVKRVFPSPAPTVYVLSSLSLLGFFLTVALRLLRTTDPLVKAQLQWVVLGALAGFLPWVLLSSLPEAMHFTPVPERYTLLCAVFTPLCIGFAILRYRLLDVEGIFDWVMVHAVALGGFSLFELFFGNWLSAHYAPRGVAKPLLLALSLSVAMLLYAPLRLRALRTVRRLSGTERPSLAESLYKLLEYAQTTGDPSSALEQTLQWCLAPTKISWVYADQEFDAQLRGLEGARDGLLGYELDPECAEAMASAAWIPLVLESQSAALVLSPRGARGWSRHDLRLASTRARASQPLFEMQRMQKSHLQTQTAMREQRDELVREMHDGLGSQIFGASLLANVSEQMPADEMRVRFSGVSAALSNAMDSLRTGLTVLSTPPGAFGPAVLALLLRAERVLAAAGIMLETQIDDEAMSLQLDSRCVFGLLRAMQEAFTNIARHSRASRVQVQLALRVNSLAILIRDDGVGFDLDKVRSGHGLTNITRRLQLLEGCAAIAAAPGAGCTIELSLPLRYGAS
jgi:signal transduction histidine kinase